MKGTSSFFAVLLLIAPVRIPVTTQAAVEANFTPGPYFIGQWDDLNQRLLFHRVIVEPHSVHVYTVDAQGRPTAAIDILKDFPGAIRGTVAWQNIAGSPDGGVVLSCTLNFGVRPLKELILSYDSSGALKGAFDASPYESSAVAVDKHGNIYIFGSNYHFDVDDPRAVYPTVVVYDSTGHVLRTMLLSSNFPPGIRPDAEGPDENGHEKGGPLLRLTANGIVVFSASTGRWFLLSQEGEILGQRDLASVNKEIADRYRFRRAEVSSSFIDNKGSIFLSVRLDDGPYDESNPPPRDGIRFESHLLKIDPATRDIREIDKEVPAADNMRFVGIENDGGYVFRSLQDSSVQIKQSRIANLP